MAVLGFDRVQISIPPGSVSDARPFHVEVLGFDRMPKPPGLDPRETWPRQGPVQLHPGEGSAFLTDVRVERALRGDDLDTILRRASNDGYRIRRNAGPDGFTRASRFDTFGNRIEPMQATPSRTTTEEQR